ncbi:permease, partial [Veillonella parvula]
MIPVYIVTGFIGSGKSTFINKQLQYRKKLGGTAIISAEEGSEPLIKEPLQLNADELSAIIPSDIKSYELIACKIADYLKRLQPKELWIEWNGMVSFYQLEALLYSDILSHLVQIEKVLYICTDQFVSTILPGLGNDVMSQLYSADCIITESDTHHALLRTYNGEAKIVTTPTPEKVEQLCRNSTWGLIPNLLVIGVTTYILLVTAFRHDIPYSIHQCFAIITGLIIEAIPFLLLGTVGSTIIRYFVPQRVLLKLLGDHSWKSYGAAMVSGFALPICDCAIIPLFKALIDRGIPLSVALLFMLASPIINPITILSTWYAFPDNPMLSVWRIVLGLVVALLVALSFRFWPPATSILKARAPQSLSYEEIVLETTKTKYIDKKRLLIHMEREFSQLLFYFSMAAT